MHRVVALVLALGAALLAGCGSTLGGLSRPVELERVDRLDLWVHPAAVNLDSRPGPDGLEMRLYLYRIGPGGTQPGLVHEGQFQFLLYEGEANPRGSDRPIQQWNYSAVDLKPFFAPDKYGLGCYQATLSWGAAQPASATVTLITRYTDARGRVITSSPADVLTRAK